MEFGHPRRLGIVYFPVQLQTQNQPWMFDATPPAVADAMTSFNHDITAISPIVMNSTAGGTNPHNVYRSAVSGSAPAAGQLPYGFEASVITDPTTRSTYKIILNLTNSTTVLDLRVPPWHRRQRRSESSAESDIRTL